ncbi:MAG TPA: acylphosphatase [Candidatus Competibacteraceae bacterium]|nr:acylphosphatase [Candidatus Competibacteraceae bacterium]
MTTLICVRCYVSGRVQGVYYRAYTRQQALRLGVTGYARNLADGRVEVLAVGPQEAVLALRDWLWEGPPAARVTQVEWEQLTCPQPPPAYFVVE